MGDTQWWCSCSGLSSPWHKTFCDKCSWADRENMYHTTREVTKTVGIHQTHMNSVFDWKFGCYILNHDYTSAYANLCVQQLVDKSNTYLISQDVFLFP